MQAARRALPLSLFFALLLILTLITSRSSAQGVLPLPATEQVKVLAQTGIGDSDLVIRPDNPLVMYWAAMNVGVLKSVPNGTTRDKLNVDYLVIRTTP